MPGGGTRHKNNLGCGVLSYSLQQIVSTVTTKLTTARNIQITRLACNLAKNKCGLDKFEDWISVVRSVRLERKVY
jgi:hypothetical protein